MDLREATREIHHAAEGSAFGKRLVAGTVSPQEWVDLCQAYLVVHQQVDPWVPPYAARAGELALDVAMMSVKPRHNKAAESWARALRNAGPHEVLGAAYVLVGAHLMGGAVIRARLPVGYSRRHLYYRGPYEETARSYLQDLRVCSSLEPHAKHAFTRVMAIMNEIEALTAVSTPEGLGDD